MSRSGYVDDFDEQWSLIRWRGAVRSAIKGARGQAFLREMLEALEAMPDKRLIEEELEQNGEVCALGSVGLKRGIDMKALDPDDNDALSPWRSALLQRWLAKSSTRTTRAVGMKRRNSAMSASSSGCASS